MFKTSIVIKPPQPTICMDVTESDDVNEFKPISNPDKHIDAGFDDGHIPSPVVDVVHGQELLVRAFYDNSLAVYNFLTS